MLGEMANLTRLLRWPTDEGHDVLSGLIAQSSESQRPKS